MLIVLSLRAKTWLTSSYDPSNPASKLNQRTNYNRELALI